MVNGNKIRINIKSTSETSSIDRRERSPTRESTSKTRYRDRSSERSKVPNKSESTNYSPINNSPKKKLLEKNELRDSRGRSRERMTAIESEVDEESDGMLSLMGFSGFGSTKGKHVNATKGGSIKQEKSSDYRQYMNRTKGFNRPLSPKRDK